MSLDRITLSAYFGEIEARVAGRRIEKVRAHGGFALRMELSSRDALFVDVSRVLAGFWLLPRSSGIPADDREVEGPSRTAALLFKKHLEGARIESLAASHVRSQTLVTSRAALVLRPNGAPSVALVIDDVGIAHFGAGEMGFPTPHSPAPIVSEPDFAEALVADVSGSAREAGRVVLGERDPGLLPLLRRWPVSDRGRRHLAHVIAGSAAPRPFISPLPGDDATSLETPPSLLPFEPEGPATLGPDFEQAAAGLYVALRRADLFRARTQSRLTKAKAEVARLRRLKAALSRDRDRWPDPTELRHQAEALLASPPGPSRDTGARSAGPAEACVIPISDPWGGPSLEVRIDPRLSLPQNANILYRRARNIEAQKNGFLKRWGGANLRLEEAERDLAISLAIRTLEDLAPAPGAPPEKAPTPQSKRYLTSRGLEILFGRSASENHDLTFKIAKREDLWFHVLDAPGGHVILRNREGRANREDIAEAASVAAFLSERRTEGQADVQYTERKHVQPAGGGKGRVLVTHAEVIRVVPRDPAGRLRARS